MTLNNVSVQLARRRDRMPAFAAAEGPRDIVLLMLTEAMLVADGQVPNLPGLLRRARSVEERAQADPEHGEDIREALTSDRLTPLDPSRPAQDLLEDLLAGIHGCLLLYREHAYDEPDTDEGNDAGDEDEDAGDHAAGGLPSDDAFDGTAAGETDDETDFEERINAEFTEAVRAAATAAKQRLL